MYKDLKLNRSSIEGTLIQYVKTNYTNGNVVKEEKSPILTRFNITSSEKNYFIDFHFNNKGGTTIQVTNGKEKEEKEKVATYLASHQDCIMAAQNENNRSMIFKQIEQDNFIFVMNEIKSDENVCSKILSDKDETNEILIKLEGKWSDKVTITYNKNTKNARVQGRPLLLFNQVISYFNELVNIDEIVEVLSDNYKESVETSDVNSQYKHLLPNSHDKHTEKLKKSLLKAVFNLNVSSSEFTCTELTFEVLRALEGHIKLTFFHKHGVESPNKYGTLAMFKWNESNKSATLIEPTRGIINCPNKIGYYEKAYKHVVVYRHKFFHWDYPEGFGVDETIQLESLDDAKKVIVDTLSLIDEYYAI